MAWNPFVAAQRFPWVASFVAGMAVGTLPPMLGGHTLRDDLPEAALLVLATTLASHLVAHTPSWPDRLSALVMCNFLVAVEGQRWGTALQVRDVREIALLVGLSTWSWGWSVLAPRKLAGSLGWSGAGLLGAVAAGGWNLDSTPNLVAVAALPVAVGLVAASAAPLRRWVLGGALLGVAVGLARCVADRYVTLEDWFEEPAGHALAGIVIALVGGLCRRARGVTVVPPDHPSRADFPRKRA